MKTINKILISSIGFAFAIGGCLASTVSFAKAEASVSIDENIGSEPLTSVDNGDYVVFGSSNTNCVTGASSDWLNLSTDRTKWIKFTVEKISGGFYLKNSTTGSYLYSSAAKKVEFSTTNKTVLNLNEDGEVSTPAGIFSLNSGKLRPYSGGYGSDRGYLYSVTSESIDSLTIKTPASKLTYKEGEAFDPTGTVLTVNYSDSTSKDFSEGYTYSPDGALVGTDTKITYNFKGSTVDQNITVNALLSVTYTGAPIRTTYNAGDAFEPDGMTITATYEGSVTEDITDKVVWNELKKGDTTAVGTFGSKTITVPGLTVKAPAGYVKVEDASLLKEGQTIVFYSPAKNKVNGSFDTKYLTSIDAAFTDDILTPVEGMVPYVLNGSAGAWKFTSSEGTLSCTGTANQSLTLNGTYDTWTIAISSGKATIKNVQYSNVYFCHNDSSPRFTTYQTSQGNVEIYAKTSGSVEDAITGLNITPSEKQTIAINSTLQITPTIDGGVDANKYVNFSTSDSSVVQLSSETTLSGSPVTVTAKKAGTATVTATSVGDSNFTKTLEIEVVNPNVVTKVEINDGAKAAGICHVNNTTTLSAKITPDVAVNKNVTWESQDTSVAIVSSSGVVTSVNQGKTKITATSVLTPTVADEIDFYVFSQKGNAATCPLSVDDLRMIMEDGVWPEDFDEDAVAYSIYFKGIVATEPTTKSGKYSFDMAGPKGQLIKVVSMNSNEVINMGDTVMAYVSLEGITSDYTVTNPTKETISHETVAVTSITVSGPSSVKAGVESSYSVSFTPSYTTQRTVVWSSSDETVATIDANGVVTGLTEGTTTITATSSANATVKDSITINVTPASAVAGTYVMSANATGSYDSTVTYANFGSYLNGYDNDVFMTANVKNIGFNFTGHDGKIYFNDSATVTMLTLPEGYSIAEVVVYNATTKRYDSTFGCGDMYQTANTTGEDLHFYPFSNQITLTANYSAWADSIAFVVVKDDNHALLADIYAKAFLSETAADCAALNVSSSTWNNVKAAFTNLGDLSVEAGVTIMDAVADEMGNDIAKAVARYDYIISKYVSSGFDNFLGRTISTSSNLHNAINNSQLLIVVLSIALISSFALVIVLKKKHN